MGNILVGKKLNMSQQNAHVAMKANTFCVRKNSVRKSRLREMILPSAPVKSHLEYFLLFWAPQYRTDMDILVYIQYGHSGHREDLGLGASVI